MRSAIAFAAVFGLMAAAPAARAEKRPAVEKFSAFAVDLAGPYASTAMVQINIERWSTPEELERLKSVFTESGDEALLEAVRDSEPVGFIRTTESLRHDLRFAFQVPLPDGARRIVIGTDRRTAFYEAANQTRSLDYPFMVVEMRVDAQGRGQGRLIAAGRMMQFGERVELENYNVTPVRLMQVKAGK
jgi:hypothetical protein